MFNLATLLGPAALATKEFSIFPSGQDGLYVRIVGRKAGLFGWLLTVLGMDATTVLEVYDRRIVMRQSSLSGATTTTLPLGSVCATASGYFKPILYLILGFLTLPLVLTIIGAIVPFLFFLFYFLYKSLLLSIEANSGSMIAIAFKRSVIEGVKVEEGDAARVIAIINDLLIGQQGRPVAPRTCPTCGATADPGATFCGGCGTTLA